MSSGKEDLAASLDEDQRLAEAAAPGPWVLANNDSDPYWNGFKWDFSENASARHNVTRSWHVKGPHVTIQSATNDAYFVPDLKHITRHDPARALRYVEAVRAIVKESSGEGHGWAEREPSYYAGLDFALQRLAEVYDES